MDTTTRERLIRLRLMLDEAEQRSRERTAIGRHLAVILLDGACEYAMGLAIAELGSPLPANPRGDSFHARYTVLSGSRIGSTWAIGTRKGVFEQRDARNKAQHQGTSVDADDLIRWSIDTETFVSSLCRAVYSIELREITLADGILTPSIRESLMDAESALVGGDAERAFSSAIASFDEARSYWRSQRADAHGPTFYVSTASSNLFTTGVGFGEWRYGTPPSDPIQEFVEVQPFSPDMGEYLWLLTRRSEFEQSGTAMMSLETAARAFRFVYFWVLRWEAFAIRYEWRSVATDEPYEPPRSGRADAQPSLWDTVEVQGDRPYLDQEPVFTVGLQIADIPDVEREHWAAFVRQALNDLAPRDHSGLQEFFGSVTDDGRITLNQIRSDPDVGQIVSVVRTAITKGQGEFERYLSSREYWIGQNEHLLAPYVDALRSVAYTHGRPLLDSMTAQGLPDDFTVLADFAISTDEWTQHDVLVSLSRLFAGVSDRPVNYESGMLSFNSSLSPTQAAELAKEIATDLLTARSNRADSQAELESTRSRIEDRMRQEIDAGARDSAPKLRRVVAVTVTPARQQPNDGRE